MAWFLDVVAADARPVYRGREDPDAEYAGPHTAGVIRGAAAGPSVSTASTAGHRSVSLVL